MAYDASQYESRRRNYTEGYAATAAANQYSRTLGQQRGARQRAQALRQYEQAAPRVVRGYSQRNLVSPNVRSGIFNRAMQDFGSERARNMSDFDLAQSEQMRGFDLEDARIITFQKIPVNAIKLIYKGTGESERIVCCTTWYCPC